MKDFVLRGLAAGAVAGVVAALFVRFVTEQQIEIALLFEDATGIGAPAGEPAEFSRSTQHLGGMLATVIYGVVLGLVLAVTVAALRHRLRGTTEFSRIAKVAVAAFVTTTVIPNLKYPANPPTVGDPDTIGERSWSYMFILVAAILVTFGAHWLWEELTRRGILGAQRFILGGGAFVLVITVLMVAMPASPDAIVPPDSDATPALQVAAEAPPEVLDQLLITARSMDDGALRNPAAPDEPLDLDAIETGSDLVGTPVAVNTTKLVPHAYTTMVWHFRLQSLAGIALLWAVLAGLFGLLMDRRIEELEPERHLAHAG